MILGGVASISFGGAIGCHTCRALFARRKLEVTFLDI
jgi:hypothetical protein